MLAKRIIPCLDVKEGRVVKGVSFVDLRDAGDPVEVARVYDAEGADELCFLDITASVEKRPILLDVVRRTAEQVFMPLTVGGGVRAVEDIRQLLLAGADKVSINTAAVERPALIDEAARMFGSQCIVIAIDAKRVVEPHGPNPSHWHDRPVGGILSERSAGGHGASRRAGTIGGPDRGPARWEVYTHGGRTATGLDVVDWAKQVAEAGAGELLLTSIDCDGTKAGYDLELTRTVARAVPVPVIASGGAGQLEHLYDAFAQGEADAVLAASIFHYRTFTIGQAKRYLSERGVAVRNEGGG